MAKETTCKKVALLPESHPDKHLQSAFVRKSETSLSSRYQFSDIRTPIAMNHVSYTHERYASTDSDAFIHSSGGPPEEPACVECAAECQDTSCNVAEMTPQCTDQCVVVACNDPTHGGKSCHEVQHCDATCTDRADCPHCSGFEEFLQCCTDYHAYISHARVNPMWNPSLDPMFCDCEIRSDNPVYSNIPTTRSNSFSSQGTIGPDMLSSGSSVASASPPFPSTPIGTNTNPYAAIPDSFNLPSPPVAIQPSLVRCMWGTCGASFSSLSDLVGHVNLQHLCLPSPAPPISAHSSEIQQGLPDASIEALSCLWGDCNLYSTPNCIPGPSTGNQVDAALNILASHLFQDHLGLPNNISMTHVLDTQPPPPSDSTYRAGILTPLHSASTPPSDFRGPMVHECSGTHVCHWQACSQTFTSCNELTAHITSVHVGAGKAHYECLWNGCKRHGEHGFASKQKICRHIQSHTGHRPFQCKVCKQNFSEAATLQQHMRRHTLEKPYLCDFPGCGKAFAITGALTIHKRTHNGQKPFKCTYCDRAFAESSNLSKHLRTHTGDRPYSCGEAGCGKTFARPDQLTRHMAVHRNKNTGNGTVVQ